jgi:hypothetical protein
MGSHRYCMGPFKPATRANLETNRNMPNKASQIDHRIYPITTTFAAGSNPAGSRVPTSMLAAMPSLKDPATS